MRVAILMIGLSRATCDIVNASSLNVKSLDCISLTVIKKDKLRFVNLVPIYVNIKTMPCFLATVVMEQRNVLLFTILLKIDIRSPDNTESAHHVPSTNLHLEPSGGASVRAISPDA